MAQFDVHRNTGRRCDAIPFVVIVQSSQFKSYRRTVVVPLVRASTLDVLHFPAFNPAFTVKGIKVVLHPLEIVSIPVGKLGALVGSLAYAGQAVAAALDELFSRAWK